MRVVGRSGIVMDLPDSLAGCLLRDGSVRRVEETPDPEPGPDPDSEPDSGELPAEPQAGEPDAEPEPEPEPEPEAVAATEPEDVVPESATAAKVRAWANANGVECPAKGRIPKSVMDAYLRRRTE